MAEETSKLVCGVIMPISRIDGCEASHWADVLEILSESIEAAGFEAKLVSNADEAGIIHQRIIQNLHDNPVVVCDVSGKNPNVMFELGLRLAFDKPTVIVKDEKTPYSFDTSAIEHVAYPRDLRFSRIVEFKQKLAEKILATHRKATSDPTYTTFLKHFGAFKVAELDRIPAQAFILEELKSMRMAMRQLEGGAPQRDRAAAGQRGRIKRPSADVCMKGWPEAKIVTLQEKMHADPQITGVEIRELHPGHHHMNIMGKIGAELDAYDFASDCSPILIMNNTMRLSFALADRYRESLRVAAGGPGAGRD